MKLYEYPQQFDSLVREINETADGEITGDMRDRWDAVEVGFQDKVEATARVIKNLQAQHEALTNEARRLSFRAKATKNRLEWLKSYVRDAMVDSDLDRVEGEILTVSVQKNPKSVVVLDEGSIPEQFFEHRSETVLSKAAILKAIDDGDDVPGATIRQTKSIRIR